MQHLSIALALDLAQALNYFYNWYTRETQPIGPFVLEGLPLFTICPSRR
jgi:hypothetical protein